MEEVIRSLKVYNETVEVMTRGNFSRMAVSPFLAFLTMFLVNLFSEFEEQFSLKILSWEILSKSEGENGRPILIHHEPKEKTKVAHSPKSESDAISFFVRCEPKEKNRVAHLPETEPDISL